MNLQIGFAVAGCGLISVFHLNAIKKTEDARLCGVFDISRENAHQRAEAFDTVCYGDFEELLADADVDAICICTPSHLHASMALAAISAGKHVLVEKPIALNLEDCDRMVLAAREKGVRLGVISQLRYSPAIKQVKRALNDGVLGIVTRCDLYMKYHRPQGYYDVGGWRGTQEMDGGGALMNQGIHGVDLVCHLMGAVSKIYALSSTLVRDIDVEDTLTAALQWNNGAQGVIQASVGDYPGFPRRIEINGEKGCIILEEDRILKWEVEGSAAAREYEQPPTDKAATHNDAAALDPAGHLEQLRNYIDAVRGEGELLVDAQDGRRALALVLAAYRSARLGESVLLD